MATESSKTSAMTQIRSPEKPALSCVRSDISPVKPLYACTGLPSHASFVRMRSYKMPSSMILQYNTSGDSSTSLPSLLSSSKRAALFRMKHHCAGDLELRMKHVGVSFPRSSSSGSSPHPPVLQDETQEPPAKRRRFQRRNSKTAAMLLSSLNEIAVHDCVGDQIVPAISEHEPSPSDYTDHILDGGLQIAQELVRTLQLQRQTKVTFSQCSTN
ncbi:hypothetical protein IV203_028668 [Nitzschia inconspicua]|uniref:Uncharacterized protein n=1 Tax=Nitzschia inconspicua TaxID=303405 RepID=A0A9K3PZZ3_9STRA|nr:hypothetical protein IV203_028668 [Nitzschia inconspicua]